MDIGKIISRASPCETTIEVASDEVEEMDWRVKLDADKVDHNAREHLEKIYPLDDPEDEIPESNDWLLTNGNTKWPEEIKPFMWRYLHDRNLYRVRKENASSVESLFQELKRKLHLPCDPTNDDEIRRKLERQIQYVTGQWREYGLLVHNQGVFSRSPGFDRHWRLARKEWIDQIHHGVTTGLVELNLCDDSVPTTTARIVFGDKEYRTKNYPAVSADLDAPPKIKRKMTATSRESSYEEEPADYKPRKRKSSSANKAPPSPTKRPSVGHRRTDSTKSLRSHARAGSRVITQSPKPIDDFRSPLQTSFSDARMYNSNSLSRHESEEDEEPFRRGHARASTRNSVSISKKDARQTSSASSTETLNGSKKPTDDSGKATLQFILEDSKDAQDNPISVETFRNSNLPEFFELASSKAFRPPGVVDCLTFRYTWGTLDAFVVSSTASDEDWAKIKKKVRNKFVIARADLRNKDIDFEVWVTCGDTTKEISNLEKEKDDW